MANKHDNLFFICSVLSGIENEIKNMSIRENINKVIARQTARIMKESNVSYDEALDKVNKSLRTLSFYIQNENDLKVIETLVKRYL